MSRRRSKRRLRLPLGLSLALGLVLAGWFALQPAKRQEEVVRLLRNSWAREKRIDALDVAWDLYQLYYSRDYIAGGAPGDNRHVYGGTPRATAFPYTIRTLGNQGYVAGYADALGNPAWVGYRVADVEKLTAPPRPAEFAIDPRTVARVAPEHYTHSGFDRGHLAPNFAIATRYGERAQAETFLMSNVVPQRPALNGGPWKHLETEIATSYPGRFGEIWVLAGPIFSAQPARLRGAIAVPDAFYMIVIDESDGRVRAQAFVLPQTATGEGALVDARTSIDEIERLTGLDFLHELDDAAEAALEARRVERIW